MRASCSGPFPYTTRFLSVDMRDGRGIAVDGLDAIAPVDGPVVDGVGPGVARCEVQRVDASLGHAGSAADRQRRRQTRQAHLPPAARGEGPILVSGAGADG